MTARSLLQSIGAYRSIAALIDRVQTFTSPQKVQGRANLGAAASGANSDITSLTGLTTPLSVGQGGTGGATDTAARAALSAAKSGVNTDITSLMNITLRDLVTILSTTTNPSVEIGRVDGNASTPLFDFHTSATVVDYNARIIASGGAGVTGDGSLSFQAANLAFGGLSVFTFAPVLPTYTVGTVPSAATYVRGLIYVSNGTANKRLAISDGTSWRFPDGAVVS
jgi:hypothetical protein